MKCGFVEDATRRYIALMFTYPGKTLYLFFLNKKSRKHSSGVTFCQSLFGRKSEDYCGKKSLEADDKFSRKRSFWDRR